MEEYPYVLTRSLEVASVISFTIESGTDTYVLRNIYTFHKTRCLGPKKQDLWTKINVLKGNWQIAPLCSGFL